MGGTTEILKSGRDWIGGLWTGKTQIAANVNTKLQFIHITIYCHTRIWKYWKYRILQLYDKRDKDRQ